MESERLEMEICQGCKEHCFECCASDEEGDECPNVPCLACMFYRCKRVAACRRAVQLTEQRMKQEAASGAGD